MALDNGNTLGIVSNSPRARAVRHLLDWTQDGRLSAGSRLPSEARLAAKLNVSRTTIRLALADLEKQGIISSDKRRRIVLGHVQPQRKFLSDAIALIMDSPDQFNRNKIHGTWHSNFVHTGAVDAIRAAGYDALTIHPDRIVGDMIQRLITERPRGVIIMRSVLQDKSGDHLAKAFKEGNIPFVLYGDIGLVDSEHDISREVDTVRSDHELGSYALTKWLIGQGRKRILRIWQINGNGPEDRQKWLAQRDAGHERAMKEAGLITLPPIEIYQTPNHATDLDNREQFEMRSRMMAGYLVEHLAAPQPVDAIMAVNDSLVASISKALRVYGREPNKDVLLVGYDNMWDDALDNSMDPLGPVATVDKKNLEVGRQLMALLQERIEGKLFESGQQRIVTPELVIRPSAFPDSAAKAPIIQPIAF